VSAINDPLAKSLTDSQQDAGKHSSPTPWPLSLSCRRRRVVLKVGLLSLTLKVPGVQSALSRSLNALAVSGFVHLTLATTNSV
jgi:hypothetical protein